MAKYILSFTMLMSFACVQKSQPTSLELSPSKDLMFRKKGKSEKLTVAAYDKRKRPFIEKLTPVWTSSDPSVATVKDGKVVAVGSGTTTISAATHGLHAELDTKVEIVGSVSLAKDTPKKLRLMKKKHKLQVTVKDDRGNIIKKPRLLFEANDYCIDVTPEGVVTGQTVGKCSVTVSSRGVSTSHMFTVK